MRTLVIFLAVVLFTSCDPSAWQKVLDSAGQGAISDSEISSGLKEALSVGIDSGVSYLSARDGFFGSPYKILLPAEARQLTDRLKIVPGFDMVENEIILRLNRAAEDAVKTAKPIFINAIKQMTFADVRNILFGEKNAATQFLYRTTYNSLYGEFHPVILGSLNKFNALDYWSDAVSAYNSIPLVTKMNPSLDDYVTKQALEGVFSMVEKKEHDIRNNFAARTTDLLKKVFGLQDK
jgi:hypothetical protein